MTDIDHALCDLTKIHMINGVPHVSDDKGYSHPYEPFELEVARNPDPLPKDTKDCRSRVFAKRSDAEKYINDVMHAWYKDFKIKYFKFDEGM